jgi:tetratricopeptide (TPR) repeat protein
MKFHSILLLLGLFIRPACDVQEENPLSSASEYFEQGVAHFHDGLYRQAEDSFGKAISLLNQAEVHINVAELYGYLGRANFELGEYRSALENLEIASQRSSQMYDYRLQAEANQWKGDVYLELRDYNNAAEYYRRSVRLSSALNDVRTRALTELRASVASINAARFDQASSLVNDALAVFQVGGGTKDMALALQQVGELDFRQGRYPEALNTLSQAFETAGSSTPLLQAKLKLKIGAIYRLQGNANDAITAFRDAVNILRQRRINRDYEALALFQIGAVYEENGRLAEARKFFSDALEIDRSLGDKIAEDYLYLFVIRCNLGLMSADQRIRATDELLKSYRQIAAKFAECGHRTGEAHTDILMGSVEESRNNLAAARLLYQKAVDLDLNIKGEYYSADLHLPILNELGIANSRPVWYDKLACVLLKLNLRNDAMAVLDLSQLEASADRFRHLRIPVRHPKVKDIVKESRSKLEAIEILEFELSSMFSGKTKFADNQEVANIQSQLSVLRKDVKDKTDRIVSIQPNYEVLLASLQKSPRDLQMAVPEGTVVLQYLPADDGLYIFALSRTRLDVERVPIGKDSLISLVREYEQLLQDPSVYAGVGGEASIGVMTRFEKLSTQLYDYFIRPVDSRFQRNLVIVACNEFRGFPFHALERQDARGNVKYLIELTSVDYLPSLSSLRHKTVSTTGVRTIVAFGNPSGKNWSVDYELHDIRSFYKSATIMLGTDATSKNIGASKADVLQLSMDFVNAPGEPDLGSFVCSTGKALGETESIDFERLTDNDPFPIIELSNQSSQGSGLTPLHALLLRMNGTSDVFLNAWSADRKAAKFFSESFYTNLAAGLAPGDAYRQALLNLISTREVGHPRSWAQFFHFGVG